jgi:hypothetical protein
VHNAKIVEALKTVIEQLVEVVDYLDGDPDLEDEPEGDEGELDQDQAPVTLNQSRDVHVA